MKSEDDIDLDVRDLHDVMRANTRGANEYWYWRDRPIMELGIAREVLSASGIKLNDLSSRGREDPPDCDAIIDGERCGIEVTELVHEKTLKKTIEGSPQYFLWDRNDLLSTLQRLIDRKDVPEKIKGGPYARYILIIVTDEFVLGQDEVSAFLEGARFKARIISDAFFALSYHPSHNGGSCPVFQLPIVRYRAAP
jgi:hypothetical protein